MSHQPTEQDQIAEGSRAFWRANHRDPAQGMWWLMGWDAAAVEAALLLQGEGHLIKSGKAVREALTEAPAALRSLIDIKTPYGLARRAREAIAACELALELIEKGPPKSKSSGQSGGDPATGRSAGPTKENSVSAAKR